MKNLVKFIVNIFCNMLNPSKLYVCRFEPSCSRYANQAIESHGPILGLYLILCRLIKCHPWGAVGYDPVPASKKTADWKGSTWKSAH